MPYNICLKFQHNCHAHPRSPRSLIHFIQLAPIWSATGTDRLKRDLLKNYDKFARPAENNATTPCTIGLTIRHIDVDETRSIMTLYSWVRLVNSMQCDPLQKPHRLTSKFLPFQKWQDHKLVWNASDYDGMTNVHVAEHEIWQPDIVLYNNAGANMDHYGQTNLILYNTGEVLWVPPAQLSVFCELDLTYWPYDIQNCSFVLGSWTYHGLALDLDRDNIAPHEVELQIENSEWKITNISSWRHDKIYACCAESYPDVTYSVQIERRSATYRAVVFTPATVVVLLILVAFWLPAASGEKIFLNGIVAVIISLFMLYFAHSLPIMAYKTPLIVKFYTHSLVLVAYSIIISTIVLACARSPHAYAVPWLLKKLTDGPLGRFLLLSHLRVTPGGPTTRAEEMRETFEEGHTAEDRHIIQGSVTKTSNYLDWIILGTAIDRLAFFIYAFMFIVMAIMYSV